MQILIIQTAFLGDVILATPVVEKLHKHFPNAKIDFLLRKGNESLLAGHPYINELIVWNKKEDKWKNVFKLIKKIRKVKYDYAINLQRFFTSGIITAFSNANKTIGFNKNPLSFLFSEKITHHISQPNEDIIHEVERNLKCIESFTDNSFQYPKLYPSQKDYEVASVYQQHLYITIAPASVWFTKQYPKEKWIELIKYLNDDYKIYILGAPSDKKLGDEIASEFKDKNIENLSGKLTLLQSAALMKGATMNYVNDSAPLHIASAMAARVTAIFCSTVPRFGFSPLGNQSIIVETREELKCRPCGLHGYKKCPQGHFKCAYTIEVQQLLAVDSFK